MPTARALVYLAEALRFSARDGRVPCELWSDYPAWRASLEDRLVPISAQVPWLTFGAVRFLESRLASTQRVFEYGSGGSTLFLARRVEQVISVEHDVRWA